MQLGILGAAGHRRVHGFLQAARPHALPDVHMMHGAELTAGAAFAHPDLRRIDAPREDPEVRHALIVGVEGLHVEPWVPRHPTMLMATTISASWLSPVRHITRWSGSPRAP
jgi:hypothetical protein